MTLEARSLSLPGRLAETSLSVAAGSLLCVVGPNGSGKTSLLHAIAGIGDVTGEVRIDGFDPDRSTPDERRRLLAYLPASRDILWPLTATDIVALGLPGADRSSIAPLLAELGLEQFATRRVDRVSTGERSRVLIARALVASPKLLLLDEPVANLDPYWQLRLMEHLRALTGRGQTALVAMHDLDLAGRYGDRLLIMSEGRIVADGEPAALLAGEMIPEVFAIERTERGWQPLRPTAGPRSSR